MRYGCFIEELPGKNTIVVFEPKMNTSEKSNFRSQRPITLDIGIAVTLIF